MLWAVVDQSVVVYRDLFLNVIVIVSRKAWSKHGLKVFKAAVWLSYVHRFQLCPVYHVVLQRWDVRSRS
jgi:hypothetical protein